MILIKDFNYAIVNDDTFVKEIYLVPQFVLARHSFDDYDGAQFVIDIKLMKIEKDNRYDNKVISEWSYLE